MQLMSRTSAQWSNTLRNVADIRNMTCFRTRISALYHSLTYPRLPKKPYFSSNANSYFVYTSPKYDVRKSSEVLDIPVEMWRIPAAIKQYRMPILFAKCMY